MSTPSVPAVIPPQQQQPPAAVINPDDAVDLSGTEARYAGYAGRVGAVLRTIRTVAASPATRYLAYTSDVGEGFRPVVPPAVVKACYATSWLYVLGDVANETNKRYEATKDTTEAARTGSQRLVFNAVASMFGPMLVIHTIVHQSQLLFQRSKASPAVQKWAPVILGLSIVPTLPYIFDHPVEAACDWAWDSFWPSKFPKQEHQHLGQPPELLTAVINNTTAHSETPPPPSTQHRAVV